VSRVSENEQIAADDGSSEAHEKRLRSHLNLYEALDPAHGQRDASFEGFAGFGRDFKACLAHREARAFTVAEFRQSGSHRRIEVDVRGAGLKPVRIKGVTQKIKASIDAAAGGKALETQYTASTGNHGIAVLNQPLHHGWRSVITRPHYLGEGQRQVRSTSRRGETAGEERSGGSARRRSREENPGGAYQRASGVSLLIWINLAVHIRVDLKAFLCASRFRRAPLYPNTPYR